MSYYARRRLTQSLCATCTNSPRLQRGRVRCGSGISSEARHRLRMRPRVPPNPYSPECVEVEFCEVHGSKQLLRRSAKHSTTAWWHTVSVETLRLGSRSCTNLYQGVATRNDATT